MKNFKFKKIDAFATKKSNGNPAGYIKLRSQNDLSDKEMLKIARELKGYVNEVGFVFQQKDNQFDLKYFSSEREVDLCGHATVAIFYDLIHTDSKLINFQTLYANTNKGLLPVFNRINKENAVFILSPLPLESKKIPPLDKIAKFLKIKTNEVDSGLPVSLINAGLMTLLVPVEYLDSILKINPDLNELKQFCIDYEVDIIEVFSKEVSHQESDFRSRVFAPRFGYLEDPATGSGNSALGYYLMKNNLWKKDTLNIEQNNNRNQFNRVKLQKQKDEQGNPRVAFGGAAITRIDGSYYFYD